MLPREKLSSLGADALSDSELLAVILRTGTKGHPVQEMASDLLSKFDGSLLQLCDASVTELCSIQGMGQTKSLELCAAFALARRMSVQRLSERANMSNPRLIASYMRPLLGNMRQEAFYVLMLDSKMRLIRADRITLGLADRSLVHAREVFRNAIRESSTAIILCHNHPSGHVNPSRQDRDVTKMLFDAGEIIGIRVIDHIIVGSTLSPDGEEYYSFLEKGTMPSQDNVP